MRVGKGVSALLVKALQKEGLDTIEGAFAYAGGEDLPKANLGHRRRTRFFVVDETGLRHELYLKRYDRERTSARMRRWWTYGIRTSPAGVEFDNIEALGAAEVPTAQAVICGQQWGKFDADRSYLIVTAAPGVKLEQCLGQFLDRHRDRPEVLERFTSELAKLVGKLHRAGYVHRDLYASHVFLNERDGRIELYLIDLARVFAPRWRRLRWRIKDLAQLKSSLSGCVWVEAYWGMFLQEYLSAADRRAVRRWDRRVDRKVSLTRFRQRRRGKTG